MDYSVVKYQLEHILGSSERDDEKEVIRIFRGIFAHNQKLGHDEGTSLHFTVVLITEKFPNLGISGNRVLKHIEHLMMM